MGTAPTSHKASSTNILSPKQNIKVWVGHGFRVPSPGSSVETYEIIDPAMPEIPDVVNYIEALRTRVLGLPIEEVRIVSPFLVRSFDPPIEVAAGKKVINLSRIGKRIVLVLESDLYIVIHLMIAGRLHWHQAGKGVRGKRHLAAFGFPSGTLTLTENATKKRASLYLLRGQEALANLDPGGVEVLDIGVDEFSEAIRRETHTLKRALTDPRLFSGIGNAYSDEILHAARLSPLKRTDQLTDEEIRNLFESTRMTLRHWIDRLRDETAGEFPEKVTAFREGMAVHGRYRSPCPVCAAPILRIVYAENETDYCARCQTGGKILADRALSPLLRNDWPHNLDDWDDLHTRRG